MIVGLFPELLAIGGVQRAGRQVAAVLSRLADSRGEVYRFLSLNDPRGLHRARVGEQAFAFEGFARRKASFAWNAWKCSLRQPRILVAAHPHLGPVLLLTRGLASRNHVLIFTHGIEVAEPLSGLRRWALRRADCILAPSSSTRHLLTTVQQVAAQKTTVLPWPLDPEFSEPEGAEALSLLPHFPAGRVVLAVGRLDATERYKGMDTLMEALQRIVARVPDARLVIVGEGDDRPRLEELAREQGVAEHVQFLGSLSRGLLRACYERCTVFALPSHGEGFGLVFLEAMACGKPVVGGAHGGIPDVVKDGATGFLVPHGDIHRLAEALERLLTDEPLRHQMGQQARRHVLENFRFEHFEARLLRLLEDVCAS